MLTAKESVRRKQVPQIDRSGIRRKEEDEDEEGGGGRRHTKRKINGKDRKRK